MPTINLLPVLDATDVSGSVLFPVWVSDQGDTYRLSMTNLIAYIEENFGAMEATSLTASSFVATTGVTVANLPSAATAGAGARAMVTNANATTFNSVVAGGGANIVPVFSDGTDWRIG